MPESTTGLEAPRSTSSGLEGIIGKLGDALIDVGRWKFMDRERLNDARNQPDYVDVRTLQAPAPRAQTAGATGYADTRGFVRTSAPAPGPTPGPNIALWGGLLIAALVAAFVLREVMD